ncbi:MAG: AAA domain-containing protein [Anaerostipes sp.]
MFEQIPEVLTKLCPCMLMSPISAAQYLQAENDLFDIVIFDEASQLPTCKAVGVLARAENAVIVGDPNQMPPTSFFAGNMVDEDNLDVEDLDSILDDCLALGMPSAYLRWHYRSRHESLIAFSNQEFYENSMLTFPSVNDRERRVRLRKIDGFFDRGKTRVNVNRSKGNCRGNQKRYQDPQLRKQTIGVVTFNISQQTLIEDMLQEEYQQDVKFDQWANTGEESLFVKNLENVQGDERDIILFSVAFGPNAEGKMSLNFGPLNKNGGWKRLNVAVSRARSEMIVFTSMTADMINLKRTKAKGVEALRDFLEFAQKGQLQSENIEENMEERQGIMEHICQTLNEHGYKYQSSVGHSKFKIDIAVMNPYNEEEYLLGIMSDGESYRQSSNTKDREVAQISVLKGLGWDIYRIWTMDWWDNKEKELKKLIECLDYKKEAAYDVCAKEEVSTEESECIEDMQIIKK